MNFGDSESERALRAEVRAVLAEPEVHALVAALADDGPEPDVRPLYRELGRRGLLAVNWPVEYGGRGLRHADAAAVAEELGHGGVPDMLHVLSVQIVGLFLLQAGSAEQRATHLPALAAGQRFATVLYTEPEVGSDLAALRAAAVRDGDDYLVSGTKVYGLKSGLSDLALCAVRTGASGSKYEGISLVLVDLHADGVHRGTIASLADEQFDRVELDRVRVGREDLVGAEGDGWPLLTRCLAIERTGLDYSLKADRWYRAALSELDADDVDEALLEQIGRHGAAVRTGRLLAWEVVAGLDRDVVDPTAAAMAKYRTSETAQEVAVWAALSQGRVPAGSSAAVLDSGYREAPGLTLSAGTSEVLLELIASASFDREHHDGGQ
ncbi:acyl-CoA dehydrogenase family protein [Actinosynnema sp. NPDC047251]|uniref:Acyl-CoA dehydrogenase domain protein n=1 Tax=Saccharothrix espanaensis (strain ATCC 51144 / DSM 44229 / JCM 9112 / NBRC 15066 / NRRL 15764) TaxID=1179773 RepID=K0K5Q8_SACES|nr:acyl-CoA dehydrogenase family protein [Saccharothrix espanaensis]CCH32937.1 Acyl-CoA dehydrogenase domain protein [Saccharothrix espanaensis DSM 44229]